MRPRGGISEPRSEPRTVYICTNRGRHGRYVLGTWTTEQSVVLRSAPDGYDEPVFIPHNRSPRGWARRFGASYTVKLECKRCGLTPVWQVDRLDVALSLREVDISIAAGRT